jgi:hypothetical protein
MSSETKSCQNCKNDFVIESDDFLFYEKMKVPSPTFCPQCRLVRRLARRNERTFHPRKCEKCDKQTIAIFSEDSGIHVYCSPCWWGDDWDALEYHIDFDESRPVLTQINELFQLVPQMNLHGLYQTKVNSDYAHMASWLKNCYMVTYSDYCENVIYGSFVNHSKDSVDNLMGGKLELCYDTINCSQCYRTFFSVDCKSCTDVWFSKNCTGCTNCFGCVNLKNQSYCIFNESYSKEEYEQKLKELYPTTQEMIIQMHEKMETLSQNLPQKYIHGWRNIGSSGDYLNDTKNAKYCFIGFNLEDCKYCSFVTGKMTDTYDFINFGESSSLMYEVLQGGDQCQNLRMSQFVITNCRNLEYCFFCIGCQDCFGCVGLKKKKYCIFNKQYTKEEYFELREKLIKHMNDLPYIDQQGLVYKYGEFFPAETSPFGYNETTAQELFPLTREEAISKGYVWRESGKRNYQTTIDAKDLPKIEEVSDDLTDQIIACKHNGLCKDQCTSAYKLTSAELEFYKRMNLPLPHLCPNCRHARRLQYRNPMMLWNRSCMCEQGNHEHSEKCQNEFETSYSPERKDKIYCESCYQQEVA